MKCCECSIEINYNSKSIMTREVVIDGMDAIAEFFVCEDCFALMAHEKEVVRLESKLIEAKERVSKHRLAKLTRMGQSIEGEKND